MTKYALTAIVLFGFAAAVAAAPAPDVPKVESPAEKIKKALDQTITLELQGQSLSGAVDDIKTKLKINIVLDRVSIQNMGISPDDFQINLKLKDVKAKTAMKQLLSQANLGSVIDGDVLLITSDHIATEKQIRQKVTIDLDKVPLETAIKDLQKQTGSNILIDPRHIAKSKEMVTLQLEDVPLEVAVRLLAEMGGMKSVRQANVLFVTTKEVAAELKKEEAQPNPYGSPYGPFFPQIEPGIKFGIMPAIPPANIVPDIAPGKPELPPDKPAPDPKKPD